MSQSYKLNKKINKMRHHIEQSVIKNQDIDIKVRARIDRRMLDYPSAFKTDFWIAVSAQDNPETIYFSKYSENLITTT